MKKPKKFPKMKVETKGRSLAVDKTPVKAPSKKGVTRPPRQAATMPAQDMGIAAVHDPMGDLHTMKRAAEIKANPSRHKAAIHHAKNEMKHLKSVMKVSVSDL